MHHIACDGWSMTVFWREVADLYNRLRRGEQAPLPALSIRYADYAVWQRKMLEESRLERLVAYWRRKLCDLPSLDLPTDRPRPSTCSYRARRTSLPCPQTSWSVAEKSAAPPMPPSTWFC